MTLASTHPFSCLKPFAIATSNLIHIVPLELDNGSTAPPPLS
jgi:hypothetical protein